MQYIRNNNPRSACAMLILNHEHQFGTKQDTVDQAMATRRRKDISCWVSEYIKNFQQQNLLLEEHKLGNYIHYTTSFATHQPNAHVWKLSIDLYCTTTLLLSTSYYSKYIDNKPNSWNILRIYSTEPFSFLFTFTVLIRIYYRHLEFPELPRTKNDQNVDVWT